MKLTLKGLIRTGPPSKGRDAPAYTYINTIQYIAAIISYKNDISADNLKQLFNNKSRRLL